MGVGVGLEEASAQSRFDISWAVKDRGSVLNVRREYLMKQS